MMRQNVLTTIALALTFTGCATTTQHAEVPEPAPVLAEVQASAPSGTVNGPEVFERLQGALPRDTLLFATFNLRENLTEYVYGGLGMLSNEWDAEPLKNDLSAFSTERIGLDLHAIETVSIAVDENTKVVLYLEGNFGAVQPRENFGGTWLQTDTKLLVWTTDKAPSRELGLEQARADQLLGLLRDAGEGKVVLAGLLGQGTTSRQVLTMMPGAQLGFALSASDTLRLIVSSPEPAVLTKIQMAANMGLSQAEETLYTYYQQRSQLELHEGYAAIVAYHVFAGVREEGLNPTLEDGKLVASVKMPTGAFAYAGAAAAVAIPAFIKYLKRSKASEAKMNLTIMADSARTYALERDMSLNKGRKKRRKMKKGTSIFPDSSQLTPPSGPTSEKVAAKWDVEPWRSLKFSRQTPSYYAYKATNMGIAADGRHQLRFEAFGDLDGDGDQSVFTVDVFWDPTTGDSEATQVFLRDPTKELE